MAEGFLFGIMVVMEQKIAQICGLVNALLGEKVNVYYNRKVDPNYPDIYVVMVKFLRSPERQPDILAVGEGEEIYEKLRVVAFSISYKIKVDNAE